MSQGSARFRTWQSIGDEVLDNATHDESFNDADSGDDAEGGSFDDGVSMTIRIPGEDAASGMGGIGRVTRVETTLVMGTGKGVGGEEGTPFNPPSAVADSTLPAHTTGAGCRQDEDDVEDEDEDEAAFRRASMGAGVDHGSDTETTATVGPRNRKGVSAEASRHLIPATNRL
jgi:hypothetical protein